MDRNNFAKKATIYIAIFFVVLFLIGMIFFRKGDNNVEENNSELNNKQLIEDTKNEEVMEEEIKLFAENFVEIYNTYAIGDFSNMESLKDSMTVNLWESKLQWIEAEKEKIKNNLKRYINFSTQVNKSNIIYFDNGKMVIEIEYEQFEIRGTSIYIEHVLTNIDEFGEITLVQIPRKSETKKVVLRLIEEDNEWKIDNIEVVKNQDQD